MHDHRTQGRSAELLARRTGDAILVSGRERTGGRSATGRSTGLACQNQTRPFLTVRQVESLKKIRSVEPPGQRALKSCWTPKFPREKSGR